MLKVEYYIESDYMLYNMNGLFYTLSSSPPGNSTALARTATRGCAATTGRFFPTGGNMAQRDYMVFSEITL